MKMCKSFCFLSLGLTTALLTSCGGGGGGGGSSSGAAYVNIQADPGTIDTGDRIKITIDVSDIHDNGIALKIKYPSSLNFVENSAQIVVNGDDTNIAPDVNVTDNSDNYLVFYLDGVDFGQDEQGKVEFELQGKEKAEDAIVGVDPDVDDPLIDNSTEFNVATPLFDAEDEVVVNVKG